MWPYGGKLLPVSSLAPKKGVVGGKDKMLFMRYGGANLIKVECIVESAAEKDPFTEPRKKAGKGKIAKKSIKPKAKITGVPQSKKKSGKAGSEKLASGKYKVAGKIGHWRTLENGDDIFFPDDGSDPIGLHGGKGKGKKDDDDAPKKKKGAAGGEKGGGGASGSGDAGDGDGDGDEGGGGDSPDPKDVSANIDSTLDLAKEKGDKAAIKKLKRLKKAVAGGDAGEIEKAASDVESRASELSATVKKVKANTTRAKKGGVKGKGKGKKSAAPKKGKTVSNAQSKANANKKATDDEVEAGKVPKKKKQDDKPE